MKISDLVFIGIGGKAVALNRTTGERVWSVLLKGSDFVNVVLQNGMLFASCYGEIFCLDPLTGSRLWHDPLKGYGTGLATIAMDQTMGSGNAAVLAEKRRRDEQAAAAAAASTRAASS